VFSVGDLLAFHLHYRLTVIVFCAAMKIISSVLYYNSVMFPKWFLFAKCSWT
jgi:hypothetical protein